MNNYETVLYRETTENQLVLLYGQKILLGLLCLDVRGLCCEQNSGSTLCYVYMSLFWEWWRDYPHYGFFFFPSDWGEGAAAV